MAKQVLVSFVNPEVRPIQLYDVVAYGVGERGEFEVVFHGGDQQVFAPGQWLDYAVRGQ